MLISLPYVSLAETTEAEKVDTDTDSQQADKVRPPFVCPDVSCMLKRNGLTETFAY